MNALTKQEIAAKLMELNRADSPVVERGEWDDLLRFLGEAFEVPDWLMYADVEAKCTCGMRDENADRHDHRCPVWQKYNFRLTQTAPVKEATDWERIPGKI